MSDYGDESSFLTSDEFVEKYAVEEQEKLKRKEQEAMMAILKNQRK